MVILHTNRDQSSHALSAEAAYTALNKVQGCRTEGHKQTHRLKYKTDQQSECVIQSHCFLRTRSSFFPRKVTENLLSSKVIPPHIHPSLSMSKFYCHRLFSVKRVTVLFYSALSDDNVVVSIRDASTFQQSSV